MIKSDNAETDVVPILVDFLAPGLDVIFVGAAPSLWAERLGHYYAGPTNKFWLLLYQAGFTPRRLLAEEDSEVLQYGIGLTGIFKHISSSANHLLPVPNEEIRANLRGKLLKFQPRFVCFNGKDVYQLFTGRACIDWGKQQERIGNSRVYVVHSSSARADGWAADRLSLYRELKGYLEPK